MHLVLAYLDIAVKGECDDAVRIALRPEREELVRIVEIGRRDKFEWLCTTYVVNGYSAVFAQSLSSVVFNVYAYETYCKALAFAQRASLHEFVDRSFYFKVDLVATCEEVHLLSRFASYDLHLLRIHRVVEVKRDLRSAGTHNRAASLY